MTMLAPDLGAVVPGETANARAGAPSERGELFAILDSLPDTKRWRAEILDGETITLSPSPIGLHGRNVRVLERQFVAYLPEGTDYETFLEIRMPDLGRSVIADFFVAPEEVLETTDHWIPPDDVLLVAEVVSKGSARADREYKRRIYACAGIEFYLIVDPLQKQTTLCTAPKDDGYRDVVTLHFGAELPVPEPFDLTLDTGAFHPY